MTETPPLNATQAILEQLGQRISAINQQIGDVQAQNPPQVQELANLTQALADANAEVAAILASRG